MEDKPKFRPDPKLKLLDQVRQVLRYHHYAYRTESTYFQWIKRYIYYHGKTHPRELNEKHIENFLSHLAVDVNIAASTQRQALNALVFLYREVLDIPLTDKITPAKTKKGRRPPTVLTKQETLRLLEQMTGTNALMVKIMYGSGLRLMERVRLRVKDVDFGVSRKMTPRGSSGK